MLGVVSVGSGQESVTLVKDDLTRSFLGGTHSKVLDFRLNYICLGFPEIVQMIYCILMPTVVKVGGSIWMVPGVTIGNPMGKTALAATTGKRELD